MKKIFTVLSIAIIITGCGGGDNNDIYSDGFDRNALLINITDNIIIPAYNNFSSKTTELENTIDQFIAETNQNNLDLVQTKWLDAYMAWQHIEMFDINMAEEINFRKKMNSYPANGSRIELNVLSESYDFNDPNHYAAQGFPSLDYMINGLQNGITIYNGADGGKYLAYLKALISTINFNTNEVKNEWISNRDNFISSTENTATSSLNKLTNDFIFYYEKGFRANKIGIPAGVFSGSKLPQNIEAYYHNLSSNNTSKTLALEAFTAINKFFSGVHFNNSTEGSSLKEYLNYLNATDDGDTLSNVIIATLNTAEAAINDLDDDLMNQINTDNYQLLVTYDKIQAAVPLLKVDMIGHLSIDIDYIDADGD